MSANQISHVLKRESLNLIRQPMKVLFPLLFFVLALSLFPLALGDKHNLLMQVAPGVLWLITLFTLLMGLESIFSDDLKQGVLEQYLLIRGSLQSYVYVKLFMHWFTSLLPIIILLPLLAQWFYLPWIVVRILMLTLLLGTPVLLIIGSVGASLALGLGQRGMLLALMVLPLFIPLLIFGNGAVQLVLQGVDATGPLACMGAFFFLALVGGPLVIQKALRWGVEG